MFRKLEQVSKQPQAWGWSKDEMVWSSYISHLTLRVVFACTLDNNNLEGTIPAETQYFHQLEYLVTPFNGKITGTFPGAVSTLQYLQDLQLQYCSLVGTLPVWIGDIKTLVNLGLGNNFMTGTVPDEIGLLDKLEILALDDNDFEGDVYAFRNMKSLKSVYLEDNSFTGSLSETMYQDWPALEELDLSSNAFITELPESIFTSETLVVLDLHGNDFKGTIPGLLEQSNTVLEFVALYDNVLTGTIPSSINAISKLRHLDLARNNLILPLPTELGDLTTMKYLFMGQNDFIDHELPPFLENLTRLRELSMKNNQITGAIPTWISALSDMQLLDLGQNELTGEIPSELGLMISLDHLLLNRNQLSGSLPDTFLFLSDLGKLLRRRLVVLVRPRCFFIVLPILILLLLFSYHSDLVLLDNNKLTGDTNIICDSLLVNVQILVADCKANPVTNITEIECKCCDLCCDDDTACNNVDWHVNLVSYCGEVWYLLVRPRCFFLVLLLILIILLFSSLGSHLGVWVRSRSVQFQSRTPSSAAMRESARCVPRVVYPACFSFLIHSIRARINWGTSILHSTLYIYLNSKRPTSNPISSKEASV
jgi:Leucine-rich repeat (LRR) protein